MSSYRPIRNGRGILHLHGLRPGGIGTCKHLESAWLWIEEQGSEAASLPPEPPEGADWTGIDQALKVQAKSRPPGAFVPDRGAALIE